MADNNNTAIDNSSRPVSVAVGIVAWNEAENIRATLESLLEQTLFADLADEGDTCQIICVCNGCVDNTVSIVKDVLESAVQTHPFRAAITYKIVELEQANKLNALNHLFQTATPAEAEVLVVMDADITVHGSSSLSNLRGALQANPEAWFSVPVGIKHGQLDEGRNMATNLSVQSSALHKVGTPKNPNWVTGQLYCVRRSIAQSVYFPKELIAEDMFLSALAHSHFFSQPLDPPDKATIVKVDGATYLYAPYLGARSVLAIQKRQAMAHVLQEVLVEWAYSELNESQRGVMALADTLRAKDAQDASWLNERLKAKLRRKKLFWKLLPNMYYTWPLRAAFEGTGRGGLALLPVAIIRTGLHLVGLYLADSAFRNGQNYFWFDN